MAVAVWYRAGFNAALAGNADVVRAMQQALQALQRERLERRVSPINAAIEAAQSLFADKMSQAKSQARRVTLSPDSDGIWQHWNQFWSATLLKNSEYADAIFVIERMLERGDLTNAERISLQLKLAQAELASGKSGAAGVTAARIDAGLLVMNSNVNLRSSS